MKPWTIIWDTESSCLMRISLMRFWSKNRINEGNNPKIALGKDPLYTKILWDLHEPHNHVKYS